MGTLLGTSPDRNDQGAEHHTRPRQVDGVQLDLFAFDFFWRDRLEPADDPLPSVTAPALSGEPTCDPGTPPGAPITAVAAFRLAA